MIYIKDKKAIEKMRTAGGLLASVVAKLPKLIKRGVSTLEIDSFVEKEMLSSGLKPECKGYHGYKYATCISLNDVVVHGVPSKDVILKEGDLVKVDVVGSYEGYNADMARCFFVGEPSKKAKRIAKVAEIALNKAIDKAVIGKRVEDISACVEDEVRSAGFDVVRDFAGHGIGKSMHEEPEIPNFRTGGRTPILREGMALAIEPMVTEGSHAVYVDKDGWSVRTVDAGLAGHVEDTILVTKSGPEVLTRLNCKDGGMPKDG